MIYYLKKTKFFWKKKIKYNNNLMIQNINLKY